MTFKPADFQAQLFAYLELNLGRIGACRNFPEYIPIGLRTLESKAGFYPNLHLPGVIEAVPLKHIHLYTEQFRERS